MRFYQYIIINRDSPTVLYKKRALHVYKKLNLQHMQIASESLLGQHDFSSFRAHSCQALSAIKTIEKITISQNEDFIYFDISARSFLHHMVRNIVGTLK